MGELFFPWTPASELIDSSYKYEIIVSGLTNTSIRQEGIITMLPNLGYNTPTNNPDPIHLLDFATTRILNAGMGPFITSNGVTTWGAIGGVISNQADLVSLIQSHVGSNARIETTNFTVQASGGTVWSNGSAFLTGVGQSIIMAGSIPLSSWNYDAINHNAASIQDYYMTPAGWVPSVHGDIAISGVYSCKVELINLGVPSFGSSNSLVILSNITAMTWLHADNAGRTNDQAGMTVLADDATTDRGVVTLRQLTSAMENMSGPPTDWAKYPAQCPVDMSGMPLQFDSSYQVTASNGTWSLNYLGDPVISISPGGTFSPKITSFNVAGTQVTMRIACGTATNVIPQYSHSITNWQDVSGYASTWPRLEAGQITIQFRTQSSPCFYRVIQPGITTHTTVTLSGDLLPRSDLAFDLGSSVRRWRELYLSGNTIYLGPSIKLSSSNDVAIVIDGRGTNILGSGVTSGILNAATNTLAITLTSTVAKAASAMQLGTVVYETNSITITTNPATITVTGNMVKPAYEDVPTYYYTLIQVWTLDKSSGAYYGQQGHLAPDGDAWILWYDTGTDQPSQYDWSWSWNAGDPIFRTYAVTATPLSPETYATNYVVSSNTVQELINHGITNVNISIATNLTVAYTTNLNVNTVTNLSLTVMSVTNIIQNNSTNINVAMTVSTNFNILTVTNLSLIVTNSSTTNINLNITNNITGMTNMPAVWDADQIRTNLLSINVGSQQMVRIDTQGITMVHGSLQMYDDDLNCNVRLYDGTRMAPSLTFLGHTNDWGWYDRGYGGHYVGAWSVTGVEIGLLHANGIKLMNTNFSFEGTCIGDLSGSWGYSEPIFNSWKSNMQFSVITLSNLTITPGSVVVKDGLGTTRATWNYNSLGIRDAGSIERVTLSSDVRTKNATGLLLTKSDVGFSTYEPVSGTIAFSIGADNAGSQYMFCKDPAGYFLFAVDPNLGFRNWDPYYRTLRLITSYNTIKLLDVNSNVVFWADASGSIANMTMGANLSLTNSANLSFYGANGTNLCTITGSTGAIKVRGQDSDVRYAIAPTNMTGFILTNLFNGITNRLFFTSQGVVTNRLSP